MKGQIVTKTLPKANALSGRSRRFREAAGAISWDRREGSSKIKSFIENIVKPVNNSTLGSRDLTKDEVNRLRLMNYGTKPSRARSGATKKSKEKYIRTTLKAAGVTPATDSQQEAGNVIDDTEDPEAQAEVTMVPEVDNRQDPSNRGWEVNLLLNYDILYKVEEGQFVENPLAFTEDITSPQDQSLEEKRM